LLRRNLFAAPQHDAQYKSAFRNCKRKFVRRTILLFGPIKDPKSTANSDNIEIKIRHGINFFLN